MYLSPSANILYSMNSNTNHKPGQLIICGLSGTTLTTEEKKFITDEEIAGVILFSKNYESPEQLATLCNSIQALRKEYPLFISVDHEGGRVIRFKNDFTQFPPMLMLAQTDSPKLCFDAHSIMGQELSLCGINVNFAPCCDIFSNPQNKVIGDRAFGTTAPQVEKLISSAIRGLQTHGVLSCAKHFPGHGDTMEDSHYHLPRTNISLDEMRKREWLPFAKAIRSRVEMVMMAHMIVDSIDPELPCSLSPKAYQLLREEFKFSKIVVTDDMQMKAITDHFTAEKAAVLGLLAGADMLLYRDMSQAHLAVNALKEALKTIQLKNELFEEKVTRTILSRKNHFTQYKPIYVPSVKDKVGSRAHQIFLSDLLKRLDKNK